MWWPAKFEVHLSSLFSILSFGVDFSFGSGLGFQASGLNLYAKTNVASSFKYVVARKQP